MADIGESGHAFIREWIRRGPADTNDRTPIESLVIWYKGASPKDRRTLAAGAAAALGDADPEMRSGAIQFLWRTRDAADGGALLATLKAHGDALARTPDPWFAGTDLRQQGVGALAARTTADDADAVEFLRSDVVQPGRGLAPIAGLLRIDPEWVVAHVAEIARGTPKALDPILWQLRKEPAGVIAVVRAVRDVVPADQLRDLVTAAVPAGPLRDRALAFVA